MFQLKFDGESRKVTLYVEHSILYLLVRLFRMRLVGPRSRVICELVVKDLSKVDNEID